MATRIGFTTVPQQRRIYRDRTGRTWLGPWIDPGSIRTRIPRRNTAPVTPPLVPAPPGVVLPEFPPGEPPMTVNCCPDFTDAEVLEFRLPEVPPGCTGGLAELSPDPDDSFSEWCE